MQRSEVDALLKATIEGLGLEWVGAQWGQSGHSQSLCMYIDKEGGITLDEIVKASRQVQAELAVAGVDMANCQLEVSSPGVNRPLFTKQDFERFTGSRVKVDLRLPLDGRRHMTGVIKSVIDDVITVNIDGQDLAFEHKQVSKAKLAPVLLDR